MKLPYILFFIKGPFSSKKEDEVKAEIVKAGAKVVFRNALAVPSEPHALEICDGVCGAVPEIYKEKFPKAEDAIKEYKEAVKNLSAKVGDVPAPKSNPNSVKALEAAIVRNEKNSPTLPGATSAATPNAPGRPPAWNPNPVNPPA